MSRLNITSPQEWHTDRQNNWQAAGTTRHTSSQARSQSENLMERFDRDLTIAQRNVQATMKNRISDIQYMEGELKNVRDKVDTEVGRFLASVEELEANLDYIDAGPLPTATENKKTRLERIGIDLVQDEVEDELQRELQVISEVKGRLTDKLNAGKAQLMSLKDMERDLNYDLADKSHAEVVDTMATTMGAASSKLGMFTHTVNPSPATSIAPQEWEGASKTAMKRAGNEVADAGQLGGAIHDTLVECKKAIITQSNTVDRAFTKRIREMNDAKSRDEDAIARTRDEITAKCANIERLTAAIDAKKAPLQLATTRLNTRTDRPMYELTADKAHMSLVKEAEALDQAVDVLQQQLDTALDDLKELRNAEAQLSRDLATKENSLALDNKCVTLRQLNSDIKPRLTEYTKARSPMQWKQFGRSRSTHLN